MRQEYQQEQEVEVRSDALEQRWYAPRKGRHQLRNVMEMTGYPPPAGRQQERLFLFTLCRVVRGVNQAGLPPPNFAVAIRPPNPFSLPIGIIVDEYAECAHDKYERS